MHGEVNNADKVIAGKSEGNRPLVSLRVDVRNHIRKDHSEIRLNILRTFIWVRTASSDGLF
jgi:hypothetical protein